MPGHDFNFPDHVALLTHPLQVRQTRKTTRTVGMLQICYNDGAGLPSLGLFPADYQTVWALVRLFVSSCTCL